MRAIVSLLFASLLLPACGNGGSSTSSGSASGSGGASSASSSSGSGGATPAGSVQWEALPTDGAPSARYNHTAVWTGDHMVIWGGLVAGTPSITATGGLYDPQAKMWKATSMTGAPAPRHSHTAVWTGSKMLVWGGYGANGPAPSGGVYDPIADVWSPMSATNQPSPRQSHAVVWTGSKMIIWGGYSGSSAENSGGIYDPASDTWVKMSTTGAPSPRFSGAAVWTGSKMMIWGGYDFFNWLHDGTFFNPASGANGAWSGITATKDAPDGREQVTGVWTGAELLVWGGWTGGPYEDSGGSLAPSATGWTATSLASAPSPRAEQVGLWTGGDMLVWGGCGEDQCGTIYGDGGRLVPSASGGVWTAIAAQDALSGRHSAAGVVAGSSVIVWGGRDASGGLATGAQGALQ